MTSLYSINKGVNQPIEFKGFTTQYIWWMGGGILALLLLFTLLYIAGVNRVVCLMLVFGSGTGLFRYVHTLSRQYGEFGMMKKTAAKYIPKIIKNK